jgi:hypothetical protein
MVTGPLRVTLENFKSMFAPVVSFAVARNSQALILACSRRRMPSNYAGYLRVTSRIPLLDLI